MKSQASYDLKTEHILPVRIVVAENVQNAEALFSERPRQAFLEGGAAATIQKGGFIVLDFGKELQGGVSIVTAVYSGEIRTARLVFGESVMESLSDIGHKCATNDHAMRDFTVTLPWMSCQRFGNTGFRFLKIEAVTGELPLGGVQAVFEYRDLEYKGSFESSDTRLNEIWNVGAYTVHLNMQEYLWDGIKRDRLVWIGDMHPETSTISAVFGESEVVPKSLDFIREMLPADGWMNGIPSYTMWWIKIHRDWYFQHGSLGYLKEQEAFLYARLEQVLSHVNADGTNSIDHKFVEWSSANTESAAAGLQSMMIISLTAGAELCAILGNDGLAQKCTAAAALLKQHVPPYAANKQIAAMAALSGLADVKEVADNVLKVGGADGLSTFWGYYVLQALAKSGDFAAAFDFIRTFWGGMLDFGATTFWEDFDLKWLEGDVYGIDKIVPENGIDIHGDFGKFCYEKFRHSLCHGWASGPTAFLSRYVLGVEVVEPGCKTVRIKPVLGDIQWVKGTYPTPYGSIEVEHENIGGEIKSKITLPDGVKNLV